jgi:hypothetical protein
MVANAGFPALAEHLPAAYAAELCNKVIEYFTANKVIRGTNRVKPPALWEPYFADLYQPARSISSQQVDIR